MGFFHFALLAGATLAAVPVVLHLIMRQEPKRFEFPALRFLQQRHEANRRRLRLRHLILLLLRMAAIALLAFALARPFLTSAPGGMLAAREAPVAAALVFDLNPRLEYRHENQTRIEAARQTADWLLAQLPADSRIAVVDTRPTPPVFQIDLGAARQRIERLEASAAGRPFLDTVGGALALLEQSELEYREMYLFSDLSSAAWDAAWTDRLQQALAGVKNLGVYVIDVGAASPVDFAVAPLEINAQQLAANSPLRISTALTCIGPGGRREVELYLVDDAGAPQMRGRETCELTAGGSQRVEFTLLGLEVGVHQGYVRIAGADGLAADDVRYFTVEVKPAWSVLAAAPAPAEDRAFFLTEALAPVGFRETGQARFECEVVSLDDLRRAPLERYAAVCLVDPAPLSDAAWQRLRDFAFAGGGVAIFLGPSASPLERFHSNAAADVLPARLLRQARYPDGELSLAPDQYDHPMLAKFRPLASSLPWSAFPVFRYWQLDTLDDGVGVVMSYSNAAPALLEKPIGKGRVMTLTTPVSQLAGERPWNLLPTGLEPWPFVMLVNEMALYLVGSVDAELNFRVGEEAVIRLDADESIDTFLLATPPGEQIRQTASRQQQAVRITATEWQGNYQLRSGGAGQSLQRGFSANLPADVARLDRVDAEQLTQIFGDAPFRLARDREQIARDVNLGRTGHELYPWLILLVAVVLGLEHLIANRFYRDAWKE